MKKYIFTPTPEVCCKQMEFAVENGVIKEVNFTGGCSGNLQGISALTIGMKVEDVVERLGNIKCGNKNTSCPAQFASALKSLG